jgi:hypothetical protein
MNNWEIMCAAIVLAWCLFRLHKGPNVTDTISGYEDRRGQLPSQNPSESSPRAFAFHDMLAWIFCPRESQDAPSSTPVRRDKKKSIAIPSAIVAPPQPVTQPYDVFLVLDVEATCQQGTDFNFPNEIIVRTVSIGGGV